MASLWQAIANDKNLNLWRDEGGQDLVEYALVLLFVVFVLFSTGLFQLLADGVSSAFNRVKSRLESPL